jgi:methylmalonyl-CoA mutase N-terminal domain/subunit
MGDGVQEKRHAWEEHILNKFTAAHAERKKEFITPSDIEIDALYTPHETDYLEKLGFPGEYPFTRGVQPNMYRGRLWTVREYAGFATAEDTNKRNKFLLQQGVTGLSVAFDLPTQIGNDSDDPHSLGEVGKVGVAIDSLKDMEILFEGIPLDKVSTSMTINAPASVLLAMYLTVAEKQKVPLSALSGTIQNDILKEYVARGTYIFPPGPSMRLICDIFRYASEHLPEFNPISISGYHIREAGSTAVQEIAFTLANAASYVQSAIQSGLNVDAFAGRLSFFFAVHNHLLEEIAKFRAARRIWAKIMKERFGAKDPHSMMLRFHAQTGGSTLTAQQPQNNIVRVTLQALASVFGGTQSLHTNSFDEALELPTEESVRIALRTQQVIAEESGVTETVDPLAGSYYLEYLTDEMEKRALEYIRKIDEMGGAVNAVETGYYCREITKSAYKIQKEIDEKRRLIVGVNCHQMDEKPFDSKTVSDEGERLQLEKLKRLKEERENEKVRKALSSLQDKAKTEENLMPEIIEAVKAYATLGEICRTLKDVFGEYKPGYSIF